MSDLGWQRRGFLNLVGLDPRNGRALPSGIALGEGEIDPRTGGAVVVNTKATADGKDGISHIKTYYWRMLPSGKHVSQKLFDIELEPGEATALTPDGHPQTIQMLMPRAIWVLGRKLYDAADEGDLGHEFGSDQGTMRNLSRVLLAIGRINNEMRHGKLPNIAKILEECAVHDAVGENLVITGQSSKGGFDFDAMLTGREDMTDELAVPDVVARALMGLDVNTLDAHQQLRSDPRRTIDSKSGKDFLIDVKVDESTDPQVSTGIEELSGAQSAHTIPCLTHFKWESDGKGLSVLKEHALRGEDMKDVNHLLRMRAMGVTNRILHDARKGEYAATIDHLVEYDLYDLVYQFTPPPPLAQGGRLKMISVGGNNMEEIANGFGMAIGGNSKVVCHEGLDKDGKISRAGVIIDLGLHLSPKDEPNVWAAPDIVEHLKYCDDILITHRHLDHVDGLFAYIQHGYLKGKTVHATPEVIRSIRDKLRTYSSIHTDDLPTFAPLKGEGWLHVKDKEGKTRLSVNYSRNVTPHSARSTPFIVHGHYDGKWIGSYLNPGDARFGSHNAPGYKGKPIDADHLDKAFFTKPNRRLLKEVPGLDPKIADRNVTYFDMDITSIQKNGWAPTEHEVEENLHEISHWFRDKGMLLAMISTNDNRMETAFRVATRSHRDITEFGTNLVKSATTANVLGVNDLRLEPEERNNIQRYLDAFFEKRLQEKIDKYKEKWQSADAKDQRNIERKIERHEARLEAFQTLKANSNPFLRYQLRDKLEAALKERFGRLSALGSMVEDGEEEMTLGSMRVGRTSRTSRAIMGMKDKELSPGPDGGRLALLTGTQGTNVEVDAALTALSEGRHPVLDGNPKNSHTARPVVPENNVVVISQSAIPGNDRKQNDLVRKLVSRGFTVVQADHDGFRIHNLDEAHKKIITKALKKLGKEYEIEEGSGTLVVSGMPIHAGGHGHKKDCEAWLNMVDADINAPQHSSSLQGVAGHTELCAKNGKRSMGRIVPNFEGIAIAAGDSPQDARADSVGQTLASLIKGETVRQQRKYHSGHIKAERRVRQEASETGVRSDGLRATARKGGVYTRAFAGVDAESEARAFAQHEGVRPEPVPENRMAPPEERNDRGPELPGSEHRHRLFARASRGLEPFTR